MKLDTSKMKPTHGYLQGDLSAVEPELREVPDDYKRRISQSFAFINGDQIRYRVHGENLHISRKIDGHLQVILFYEGQIFMMGRRGVVRTELPCLEAAKAIIEKAGITSMVAAAELYAQRESGRSRVYDVIAALSHDELVETLGLAFFDILELDGQSLRTVAYGSVFKKLAEIFPTEGAVQVVETVKGKSKSDVEYYFDKWVGEENAEGVIVRGDMPYMYKIKPKHTFDVAIVGYVEGANDRKGLVKSLLIAFMRESGVFQVVGKVGNNLSEAERQTFFEQLSLDHVQSNYIETDNEGVAFHFVTPKLVIEVGCNDLMTENTYGKSLMNNLITFQDDFYSLYHATPGVRLIYPMFERIREDKTSCYEDIRFNQLKDLVYIEETNLTPEALPHSDLLFREVYTKSIKNKIMVQKFVVWKTNKETVNPQYPAYVMYYTNFSSGRKEPLQNEINISSDEEQIMEMARQLIANKIKRGWKQV
ncbi:hypothetical protein QUF64_04695 [Anaerolineales bacterium HSG6]|nr:hypothetical protein [Anaerolineales bacterium HSG6]MDM8532384.1 hypothetical protein [Anaerolineales bacterium HSG25]